MHHSTHEPAPGDSPPDAREGGGNPPVPIEEHPSVDSHLAPQPARPPLRRRMRVNSLEGASRPTKKPGAGRGGLSRPRGKEGGTTPGNQAWSPAGPAQKRAVTAKRMTRPGSSLTARSQPDRDWYPAPVLPLWLKVFSNSTPLFIMLKNSHRAS